MVGLLFVLVKLFFKEVGAPFFGQFLGFFEAPSFDFFVVAGQKYCRNFFTFVYLGPGVVRVFQKFAAGNIECLVHGRVILFEKNADLTL